MDNYKKYICSICNKLYSSYSSLWNHNKKFHTVIDLPLKCKYCDKIYKHTSSKIRHEKTCDGKYVNYNNKIIKENIELKNTIDELKNKINIDVKENKKKSEIINNTTNNNTTNNNTTNNNNNNNTTNNNNITNNTLNNTLNNNNTVNNIYVKFSNLDYEKALSQEEIKELLNEKFMILERAIKKIHFNPDKKEYNNIFITNLKGDYGYVYDGGDRLIVMKKDALLDELISNHVCEIDKHKDMIINDEITFKILDAFVLYMIDDKTPFQHGNKTYNSYTEFKKEILNLLIYNNTDIKKFNKINKMNLIEKNND
jgi:hypothetical protein